MPEEIAYKLSSFLQRARMDWFMELLERHAADYPETVRRLKVLAEGFEYDKINEELKTMRSRR